MDVQSTKDKQVVVHHDKTLLRLTGLDEPVSNINYDEIPKCLEEVELPFGESTYVQKPGIDDGKIPLLKDVFRDNPGVAMNIDLKGGDSEQLFEVYKLITEYQREKITYFGDMNEKKNRKAEEMGKDAGIRTFRSISGTLFTIVFYFLGILQFLPFRNYSIWFPFFGPKKIASIRNRFGNS